MKTKILLNKEPKWVINSLENLNNDILSHQDLLFQMKYLTLIQIFQIKWENLI